MSWRYAGALNVMKGDPDTPGAFTYRVREIPLNPAVRIFYDLSGVDWDFLYFQPVNYIRDSFLVVEDGPPAPAVPSEVFYQFGDSGFQDVPGGYVSSTPAEFLSQFSLTRARDENVQAGYFRVTVTGADTNSFMSILVGGQNPAGPQVDSSGSLVVVVGQPAVEDIETRQGGQGALWQMGIAQVAPV